MKMSDYIKWMRSQPIRKARELGNIEALMITHERPGMLKKTVLSFLDKTPGLKLTIFDDGSSTQAKLDELVEIETYGICVVRCPKSGFIGTWLKAFEWTREHKSGLGGVILLEDDLSFARGWNDVLVSMYEGAADLGFMPGAMSCLRVHDLPQNMMIVSLRGISAYQVMWQGFQVNLMPWEVIENRKLIDDAAQLAKNGKHGIDVYLLGMISDRMGRTNFVSMESWIAHEGLHASLVEAQGYRSLKHRGISLVKELDNVGKERCTEVG